jgi:protein-tyrosine-phosphatase
VDLDDGLRARAAVYAALGDPLRLAMVEELVVSDRTPSELRRLLGIESNLAAHHVGVLEAAGLVERSTSDGDGRRRYLRLRTHPAVRVQRPVIRASGVVFVCSRNSARSQLAAALWNRHHPVPATSAGTHPADAVHPRAVQAAAAAGLDLNGAVPSSLDDLDERPDLVVTVCDLAHEELEQAGLRELHWSTSDPAASGRLPAFHRALRSLETRIDRVAPLVAAR